MKEKKTKRITIRLSLEDYLYLKRHYTWYKKKHKTFSEYIRYLLDIGIADYY